MARLSIGEVIRKAGCVVQDSATQLAAGAAKKWLADNRVELMAAIKYAQTERGAALLNEFCIKVPLAAGVITMAMKGTPEMAIASIGMFDAELAGELKKHRKSLAQLQECWRLGQDSQSQEQNEKRK